MVAMALIVSAPLAAAKDAEKPVNPEKVELAAKVLAASGFKQILLSSIDQLMQATLQGFQQRAQSPEERELIQAMLENMNPVMEKHFPEVTESIAKLYASKFTKPELEKMLRFHQSELGRKIRRLNPELQQESQALGRQWMESIMPEILERAEADVGQGSGGQQ